MAHFARLDENNQVVSVNAVDNQWILDENGQESEEVGISFLKSIHGEDSRWVQTSYNNNIRGNYAGIGFSYFEEYDIFMQEKPFPSWIINPQTVEWDPPTERPTDFNEKPYAWNEETLTWDSLENPVDTETT